jgi:MYXO-CTERM domain-containing protein
MHALPLLGVLLLPSSTLAALEVGLLPATRKVLPGSEPGDATSITIGAGLGEHEGLQVALRSDADLAGVDLRASALLGPDGATIPADAVEIFLEHLFDIEQASPSFMGAIDDHPREAGRYPDPLVPLRDPWAEGEVGVAAPFDLPAGETRALYVDVDVPLEAAPGRYEGSLVLSVEGEQDRELTVALTVWPFALPQDKTVATSFGFSSNLPRRFHGGPDGEESEDYGEILRRYHQLMHDYRIDPTGLPGSVSFELDAHGAVLEPDWSAYDAELEPFLEGDLFDDGAPVTRFNVGHFRPGSGQGELSEEQWGAAARMLSEHLEERGWWERAYVYSTDEPYYNGGDATYEQIHHDVGVLHERAPLWDGHVLVTSPYNAIVDGDIDIWCPVTPMYDAWFFGPLYEGRAFYEERRAMGEELWFYVCNANFPPYAGYDIDTALGYEPRMVKWGTWYEGATGFLFWRVNYWIDDDPWNVWANFAYFGDMFGRNGDGVLLYPGDHDGTAAPLGSPEGVSIDGPIASYRLAQIRDGLEDWELFLLATELGAGDYTRAQVGRAYRQFGTAPREDCDDPAAYCPDDPPWTLDEAVLLDARWNIASKVAHLMDPQGWPDPEDAADTGDTGENEPGGCGCAVRGVPTLPKMLSLIMLVALGGGLVRRRR